MSNKVQQLIESYLSEEDKKQIAKDLFKEELRKGFIENQKHKRIDNYERVVNNAVHHYISSEIDSIVGTDFKAQIEKQVKKALNKDVTYSVFRNESPWGDKKSIAQQTVDDTVIENKHILVERVIEGFKNINIDNLDDYLVDTFKEVLMEKLKA